MKSFLFEKKWIENRTWYAGNQEVACFEDKYDTV